MDPVLQCKPEIIILLEISIQCKLTDTYVSNTILDMASMEKRKKSQTQTNGTTSN